MAYTNTIPAFRDCIYDIEVFKHDWIVVFKFLDTNEQFIYHNDKEGVVKFIQAYRDNTIFSGFNSKNYDAWILAKILAPDTTSPVLVKQFSDLLIKGNDYVISNAKRPFWWNFKFMTFDLKCAAVKIVNLSCSLKSIEANMGHSITESKISFDIELPLSPGQLKETIEYCVNDVNETAKLLEEADVRADLLGQYNLYKYLINNDPDSRMRLADFLIRSDVTHISTILGGTKESKDLFLPKRKLIWPGSLEIENETLSNHYINGSVLKETDDEYKLTMDLGGIETQYGTGGIHGAIPNYVNDITKTGTIIINADVAQFYPSIMLNYNLFSRRSHTGKDVYRKIYNARLEAKKTNDQLAPVYKLILNKAFGAIGNQYNPLYDKDTANMICIYGQLYLTMLIEKLLVLKTIKMIQYNTDGIMFEIKDYEHNTARDIMANWTDKTRFNLELDYITNIVQKDVSNYVYINSDNKIKTKGTTLKHYKDNSIIKRDFTCFATALVDCFINGIPIDVSIKNSLEKNVMAFQKVVKHSAKQDGIVLKVDNEYCDLQRCNRIFVFKPSILNETGEVLYKIKDGTDIKYNKYPGLPTNCFVINTEINVFQKALIKSNLDIDWYINEAEKLKTDFLEGR